MKRVVEGADPYKSLDSRNTDEMIASSPLGGCGYDFLYRHAIHKIRKG